MKQWFDGLEPRERIALILGTLALGVFLLYMMVLRPAHSGYAGIKHSVSEQRVTASWMQQSAARLQQLTQTTQQGGGQGGRSLLAITDATAREGALATSLKRIEPEGSNGVRVWLEGASFDDFIAWIDLLDSSHGIAPDSVSMEKAASRGRVDVRLTLQAARP